MGGQEISTRILSHWKVKLALNLWVATGFTAIYLLLQRVTLFPVTPVKFTWIDRATPFVPGAVYLYESLWLMLPLVLWLMPSREALGRFSRSFFLISLVSFGIFLVFPTCCPRPGDIRNVNPVYGALIRIDKNLNAFPSLHVALAVLCGACCQTLFGGKNWRGIKKWLPWGWVFGILASTLLTKQHGVIDALGGALVGVAGYAIGWRGATPQLENRG